MKTSKKILVLSAAIMVSTFSSLSLLTKLDVKASNNITSKIESFKAYDNFNEFSEFDNKTFIKQMNRGYDLAKSSWGGSIQGSNDQHKIKAIFFHVFALNNEIIKYASNYLSNSIDNDLMNIDHSGLKVIERNYINLKYNLQNTSGVSSLQYVYDDSFGFTGSEISNYILNKLPTILKAIHDIQDFKVANLLGQYSLESISKYFEALIKIKNFIPDFVRVITSNMRFSSESNIRTYQNLYSTTNDNLAGNVYMNVPLNTQLINEYVMYNDNSNRPMMVHNMLDLETYRSFATTVDANFIINAPKSMLKEKFYNLLQKDIFKSLNVFFNNIDVYNKLAGLAIDNLRLHKNTATDDLEYINSTTNTTNTLAIKQWTDFVSLEAVLVKYNVEFEAMKAKILYSLNNSNLANYDNYMNDIKFEINKKYDEGLKNFGKSTSLVSSEFSNFTSKTMSLWKEKLLKKIDDNKLLLTNTLKTKAGSVRVSVTDLNRLSSTVKSTEVNITTDGSYRAYIESLEPSDGSLKVNLVLKISDVELKTSKIINNFQTQAQKQEADWLVDLEKLKAYAQSFTLFVGNKARLSKKVKIGEIDIEKGPEFQATIESIVPKDGTLGVNLLLTLNNAQYRVTKEITGFYTQAKQNEVNLNKLKTKENALSVDVTNKNRLSNTVIVGDVNITKDNTYTAVVEKVEPSDGRVKVFLKLTLGNAVHKITKDITGFKTLAQDNVEKLISAAEVSVNNAGESTENSQAKINQASQAYNALPKDHQKSEYLSRTNKAQYDLYLKDANKKVVDLETIVQADNFDTAKVDADLVTAKEAVNKVKDATNKTNLNNRLNAVEQKNNTQKTKLANQADATNKIKQAIDSVANPNITTAQSQELINQAQKANDKLDDGDLKTQNQAKIDKAQVDLFLKDATKKVVGLETAVQSDNFDTSKVEVDLAVAKEAVNKVKDTTNKTNLNNRLNAVEQNINAQNAQNEADKADAKNKIDAATAGVGNTKETTAETQDKINDAQDANNKLPEGQEKTDNQSQINKAQADLNLKDATKKVTNLENLIKTDNFDTSKADVDLIDAKNAVTKLDNGTQKDNLNTRLDAVETKINAQKESNKRDAQNKAEAVTAAVGNAEEATSETQDKINDAQEANDKLPEGKEKTDNQAQIDKAQADLNLKDANKKVQDLENLVKNADFDTSKAEKDLLEAKKAVAKLENGTQKDNLNTRLGAVETIINDKKETTKTDAKNKVDAAIAGVKNSEEPTSETQDKINKAQEANEKLPEGEDKTNNQAKLDKAQADLDLKDAKNKIDSATTGVKDTNETTAETQDKINNAQEANNKLPEGQDKTNNQYKIDKAQADLDLKDTTKRVVNLETVVKNEDFDTSNVEADLTVAKAAVDKVKDTVAKADLNNRLNAVQQKNKDQKEKLANQADATDKINQAIASVADPKATTAKSQELIDQAQQANGKLTDGDLKTQNQAKIDKAQVDLNLKDATKKVVDIEDVVKKEGFDTLKVGSDLEEAQSAVDKLNNGKEKDDLTSRINKLQTRIENKDPLLNKETIITIIVLSVLLVGTLGAIIFLLKGK